MIVALAAIVVEVAVGYYALMMSKVSQETYKNVAKDISASVAEIVPVDDFIYVRDKVDAKLKTLDNKPFAEDCTEEEYNAYIANFDSVIEEPEFKVHFDNCLASLQTLQTTNSDFVDCIYLTYVDYDNRLFVYLIDAAEEDACDPGCLDPIYEMNVGLFDDHTKGFDPYVTKTDRYGWLITAGTAIYSDKTNRTQENVVGYAMADISMYTVRERQANSIVRMFFYMLLTLLLIGALGVIWVSLWMIRHLKALTNVAKSYDASDPKGTHEKFQNIQVKTKDEVGDLAESIKTMENDVYDRFNALVETNRQLLSSREETKRMQILANQDGLTGVHNKVAYNSEVERMNKDIKDGEKTDFAVVMVDLNYLKEVNDTYGHDTGDIALIKLATMICDTFTLSPVYRVGGDEFVVICRGKDYLRISQLVEAFKHKVLESIKDSDIHDGEHISAAVGYSTFNQSDDKNVDDVFKRADKEMYENKRDMKNEK